MIRVSVLVFPESKCPPFNFCAPGSFQELHENIVCPAASNEFSKLWNSDMVRQMEVQNKGLVEYLGIHSGIPDFEFRKLWMVFDTLFCMVSRQERRGFGNGFDNNTIATASRKFTAIGQQHAKIQRCET